MAKLTGAKSGTADVSLNVQSRGAASGRRVRISAPTLALRPLASDILRGKEGGYARVQGSGGLIPPYNFDCRQLASGILRGEEGRRREEWGWEGVR